MFVLKLWRYILGFYQLQVVGWNLEKLINISASRGLNIWNISRDEGGLLLNASLYSFSQLKEISQRLNCSLTIKEKQGLPFIFAKLKKRKIFFIGPILLIIILYILSSFIWFIEIEGLDTLVLSDVLVAASEAGLNVGVWKSTLEPRQIERILMNKLDKTAWVGIEIQGTKAIIRLVEKVVIPPEDLRPCHLIAEKDGIITEIIVLEGKGMVKKGQTVKKGDLLISGLVELGEEESADEKNNGFLLYKPVKAKGIVRGKTWYEAYAEVPLTRYSEKRTGHIFKTAGLKIYNQTIITQYKKNIPFRYYQREEYVKKFVLWRNLVAPVEAIITTYYEVNRIPEQLGKEQALLEAKNVALNIIRTQISQEAKIISQEYFDLLTTDLNLVRVKLLVEAEEDLGKTIAITE